jgi:FHS family glucose/mannose:H+ symporter-like MFS transporter
MYKKKVVFWAACIGMLFFGISLITLGSVVPDLKDKLHINDISSGTLFSILPFGILSGSLLFGPIVDKYGYRILLSISCVFMFAGFEGIAYAPSTNLLKICIYLVGFGGGAVNGATNALVADISDKDKGANLSLLGAFFGIGALGMPLILGIFKNIFNFEVIVATVGVLTLVTGTFFLLIKFPPPKQTQGFPITRSLTLLKDKLLILIAFFLFFQSSFEGIINNWTTTYLIKQLAINQSKALYALSSFVAGMCMMRLLIGSVFRSAPVKKILIASFVLILTGLILLKTGNSFNIALMGLVCLGAGLAGGFPIMLGFVGDRYTELSGSAFSFVLFIALIGNMLVNYGMGIIAQNFGIHHLITVAFAESVILILLCLIILNKIKNNK